jgi:hypothetical protein
LALLIELENSLTRSAFAALQWFGLPDHFNKVMMLLYFGANSKVNIGEEDSEVDRTVGVRQGSCKGPESLYHAGRDSCSGLAA